MPTRIAFGGINAGKITYIYNAAGQKVQKKVANGSVEVVTDYLNGFQYKNNELQFFPHAEGYVNVTKGEYNYVFSYTDHLGNVRLTYGMDDSANELKILEENNYYPFGLKHANYNMDKKEYDQILNGSVIPVPTDEIAYKYKYNGKELQDELGLNWYDYGARNYDPAIGRWVNIDPLADKYENWSSYNYCLNNPVVHIDPDGRSVDNEYNFNVQTGKTTQVSNKGGDTTDYVNVVSNGKTIYTDVEKVQKTTVNIQSTTSERGTSFTQRLPGEIRTTNIKPTSGALEDPSAGLMADYVGGKVAGLVLGKAFTKLTALIEANSESKVFRVFGGDAKPDGFSWTTVNPNKVDNFRDAAGLPSGGASGATNTGRFVIEGTVKNKDIIKVRDALPLDGNRGGLRELIIAPKNVNVNRVSGANPSF